MQAAETTPDNSARSLLRASAIHHLGIAVASLAEARTFYEGMLGGVCEGVEEVGEQRVRVAFIRIGGGQAGTLLELLEPIDDTSAIAKFLAKRGPGLHHVAYQVTQLEDRLAALAAAGVELIDRVARIGAHGMRIAFLHPRATGGVLTELCEPAQGLPAKTA